MDDVKWAIQRMREELEEVDDQVRYRIDTPFSYTKPRTYFGRPTTHFRPCGPITVLEKRPDREQKMNFVKRLPVLRACQTDFGFSLHEVVTKKTKYLDTTIAPWSKDDFDTESATRIRKKLMKEEDLLQNMPSIQRRGERCCIQNSVINIYENYFEPPSWEEADGYEKLEMRMVNRFKDFINAPPRPVQCIQFEPFDSIEMVAAYSYLTYRRRDFISECQCYIWNLDCPDEPVFTLEPAVPVTRLDYNPKLPKMILGGLITGQLCYWDIRSSSMPAAISGLHTTFREPPSGCLWIHSRTGFDCFAASTDGQVIWYDVRNFSEPVEALILDLKSKELPNMKEAYGVSALEFEPTIPTKFMVGLETGSVLVGNRKGKTLQEKFSQPYYAFPCPVRALSRNPSNLKCFICVGGYEIKIFAEDCKESYILWSKSHPAWVTSGKWSPTKNSVFFTTRKDGYLDVWDLLRKVDGPVLSDQISHKPLRCLEIHDTGKHISTGGDNGSITLMEISSHFYVQDKNDRSLIASMFDRESKREKLIDARNREVRLQQRQREAHSTIFYELPEDKLKRKAREDFIKSLNLYDLKKQKIEIETEEN